MAGFMNKELETIRDSLVCAHCQSIFKGTDSQARKVKYEKTRVFCSTTCRADDARDRLATPIPERGPCLHCGIKFFSRRDAKYCSNRCYQSSSQHEQMRKDQLSKINTSRANGQMEPGRPKVDHNIHCLNCGIKVNKPTTRVAKTKYCSAMCYRSYLAKRFERWVTHPPELMLPADYAQFLDQDDLCCLVIGCQWKGKALSNHMNYSHGMPADDFKRYMGFNRSTGVVSKTMRENLKARPSTGVALNPSMSGLEKAREVNKTTPRAIDRAQARQNRQKSRELSTIGPMRICHGCGIEFQQSTMFGYAKYCTIECRDKTYSDIIKLRSKIMARKPNGTFSWVPKFVMVQVAKQ